MASDVVQFRFPQEDLAYLERHGIHANEAAREQLQGLVRSLRVQESLREIRKHPTRKAFDPAQAVREGRSDR